MRPCFLAIVATLLLCGCHSNPERTPVSVVARFLLESDAVRTAELVLPVSGVAIRVIPKPVISEFDIVNVELAQVELGRCLMFQVTPDAARDLYRLTAANQGRRLVLLLNDVPMGARVIERPLEGGVISIFSELPEAELPGLVARLKHTVAVIRREAAKRT
jgi:hypothetical protein